MINRVYLKILKWINIFINSIATFLNKNEFVKTIRYSELYKKNDIINVSNKYPVNFNEKDNRLFNEWKNYSTFENKIFAVNNVNLTAKGIVFKGAQCFVPALPHPVFKADFGLLYIIGQTIFKKKVQCSVNVKYLLVFDLWAYNNYFHWMVDSMCRLIEWREILNEYTVIIPENSPRYISDTLTMLNIKSIEVLKNNSYLFFPNLFIPNYAAWSGQQNPVALKKVRKFILENVKESKRYRYIYISRSKQKVRRVSNENELINILKEKGFEIIYFEGMSVAEQVAIVKDAKIIVSSHGANFTNAIFAANARVLELIRNDKPNFCYWSTLTNLDIPYYYQLCEVTGHDDLFVDIELFKKNLINILNS